MGNHVPVRIIVAGSSGFIGSALVARLRGDGHDVVRLVRRTPEGSDEVSWNPADGELDRRALTGVDVAINVAGAGVGDRRWTPSYKRTIIASRVDTTTTLSRAIAAADDGPRTLLNQSAIGYYGDRGDEILDESSTAGEGFFPDVCRAWEAATQAAEEAGVRVCRLRTGLVVGPGGGMMKPMIRLFKAGFGGTLGNGREYQSWVSLADVTSAFAFLAERSDVAGPVNVTGPEPVRNVEFTRELAAVLHRPAILPAPKFGLRMALGEFGDNVVESARVLPRVLVKAGYTFTHANVTSALQWAVTGA
jgi:uncharacterized protein (TIGR01777 family)